ncbi:L-threonine 3-dehydrogenase [Providencia heimbachae]|uniref:zinc-binding dehydrogenase n=2 Tax=Providencia heimbachae TaxID=333962 RepID=UPI000DA3B4BD|nr:zinc-binding dehydrogenase [Providencia heimbachae]SQH14577.1 L-threonine 3-dehydrogenase [Providencia heimbachae]
MTVNIGDKICCVPLIPNFETEESKRGYYSLGKGYSFIGSRQPGGNAEYVVMPESSCFILPDDITEIEGAFFEPVTVGIHPILMAGGCKDKNVVIVGVGTIGMLAMQSAKALGAKTVTAIDISDEKLALAKELGADYVINSSKEKENQEIEFLEIIKFDQLILETAGVPQTFKLSLELAGPRAQLALVGTLHKDLLLGYKEYEQILRKELTIIGSWMNYSKPFPGDEWEVTINLFRNKKIVINPLIEEVVNSDKYIKKVIGLNGYPANGKILLKWD